MLSVNNADSGWSFAAICLRGWSSEEQGRILVVVIATSLTLDPIRWNIRFLAALSRVYWEKGVGALSPDNHRVCSCR